MAVPSGAFTAPPDYDTRPPVPGPVSPFAREVNLAVELAITQFKLKYVGSVLGYVWSLVKPLILFATTYVIFQLLFHTGRGSDRFTFQLLLAIVIWAFFADATGVALGSIAHNNNLIRKAYFPRWVLVIASTFSALITFVINLVLVFVVCFVAGGATLSWNLLFVPLLLVELYVLILGIGLGLSALFAHYRDVGHLWEITTQVLFYGSAVVYPISLVPTRFQGLVMLNPAAQVIEDLRRAMITPHIKWSTEIAAFPESLAPFAIVLLVLGVGALIFRSLSPRFAEAG